MDDNRHFRIETSRDGTRASIALAGELDSDAATALASEFARAVAEGETHELVLDLSQTAFIDSTGMRTIIQIETAAREQSVPLVVKPPPDAVTELLRLTGVAGRLDTGPQHGRGTLDGFVERVEIALPRSPDAPARARAELREAAPDYHRPGPAASRGARPRGRL